MKTKIQKSFIQTYFKNHIACICGYKIVRVNDKSSKPFKTYLGQDAVYNSINSMIKESKHCSEV